MRLGVLKMKLMFQELCKSKLNLAEKHGFKVFLSSVRFENNGLYFIKLNVSIFVLSVMWLKT